MKIEELRNHSLKIISDRKLRVELSDYSDIFVSPNDVTEICAFIDDYTGKYYIDVFLTDRYNGFIEKSHKYIPELLNLIRNLSNDEFEKFSALVCKCLGYTNFFATKTTNDQGIDFIAYSSYSELNIDYKQHILGQCKHFEERLVDTRDIRELAGSVILFSRKEFATTSDPYSKFTLGSFSPINVFFLSNYFFSSDALELCRKTSIVPLDIIDITCITYKGIINKILDWLVDKEIDSDKIIKDLGEVEITK